MLQEALIMQSRCTAERDIVGQLVPSRHRQRYLYPTIAVHGVGQNLLPT